MRRARSSSVEALADSWLVRVRYPEQFAPYLIPVGSITLDGISLTVARLDDEALTVAIIPHTWEPHDDRRLAAGPGREPGVRPDREVRRPRDAAGVGAGTPPRNSCRADGLKTRKRPPGRPRSAERRRLCALPERRSRPMQPIPDLDILQPVSSAPDAQIGRRRAAHARAGDRRARRAAPRLHRDVRLPDERRRLRARRVDPRRRGLRADAARGRGRRRAHQHVRHPREGRGPRARPPRASSAPAKSDAARPHDRRARLHGRAAADEAARRGEARRRRRRAGRLPRPARACSPRRPRPGRPPSTSTSRARRPTPTSRPSATTRTASAPSSRIMRGCDNMCAFCVVPFTRGRERSRPVTSILAECAQLVDAGYKEVTVLGQNVNSYRVDADGHAVDFAELLYRISLLSPELRIRYSTSHPKDCSDALLHVHRERPTVCDFIHLPVQHGNTDVLAPDAADVHPRAVPRPHRAGAQHRPRPRVLDRHHRRVLRRDGGRARRHALAHGGRPLRPRVHVRLFRAAPHLRRAEVRGRRARGRQEAPPRRDHHAAEPDLAGTEPAARRAALHGARRRPEPEERRPALRPDRHEPHGRLRPSRTTGAASTSRSRSRTARRPRSSATPSAARSSPKPPPSPPDL